MTTHADALRDLARDTPIGGMVAEHPNKSALLAGAAAIDTLTKVQKVAEILDRMAEDSRKLTHLDWARGRAEGQAHSYTKAAEFIRDALGGTP